VLAIGPCIWTDNMHDYAAMLAFIDLWHRSRNNCCLAVAAAGVGLPLITIG
jgi:hypothetical protein